MRALTGAGKNEVSGKVAAAVGLNVARHRQALGLSQEEVADRAGLHRTEISLMELGKRTPRIDTIVRVSGALGISIAEAFVGISWSPFPEKLGGYLDLEEKAWP
ncbi:MAG TPA: helix-turn-helix transcriptional regulator [Solirubrobacterales bacterium]|jgi:transcriptional regulator with XRE-family HTH domain|nr:helix-turn-helix transcriptional regulator [Solirubrobacterales bacterium]